MRRGKTHVWLGHGDGVVYEDWNVGATGFSVAKRRFDDLLGAARRRLGNTVIS
jgi:hypothetical protein